MSMRGTEKMNKSALWRTYQFARKKMERWLPRITTYGKLSTEEPVPITDTQVRLLD